MDVALQVPAYDEDGLTATLDAWERQPVPDHIDSLSYEAWVTPSAETKERCRTWRQAEAHETFAAVEAPQYKLPTRNAAHSDAVERGHDVVITADADAPPLSRNTLTRLTAPLTGSGVACVCANPVASTSPIGVRSNIGVYLKEAIGGIHGQCHAISADAWRGAGPFKIEGIDHTDVMSVWQEEEYAFGQRLRQHGRVVYAYRAPVHNDTRRRECTWYRKIPGKDHPFCDRKEGDDTFAPRSPR